MHVTDKLRHINNLLKPHWPWIGGTVAALLSVMHLHGRMSWPSIMATAAEMGLLTAAVIWFHIHEQSKRRELRHAFQTKPEDSNAIKRRIDPDS